MSFPLCGHRLQRVALVRVDGEEFEFFGDRALNNLLPHTDAFASVAAIVHATLLTFAEEEVSAGAAAHELAEEGSAGSHYQEGRGRRCRMSTYRLTLAIHPSTYGFGYALADGPLSLVDWGLAHAKGDKNTECLRKAEKLLVRYRPDMLVLEEFDTNASKRHHRIRELCRSLMSLASMHHISTRIVSRTKVAESLGLPETAMRYEVAKRAGALLPELRHLLPPPRRAWESEARNGMVMVAATLIFGWSCRKIDSRFCPSD